MRPSKNSLSKLSSQSVQSVFAVGLAMVALGSSGACEPVTIGQAIAQSSSTGGTGGGTGTGGMGGGTSLPDLEGVLAGCMEGDDKTFPVPGTCEVHYVCPAGSRTIKCEEDDDGYRCHYRNIGADCSWTIDAETPQEACSYGLDCGELSESDGPLSCELEDEVEDQGFCIVEEQCDTSQNSSDLPKSISDLSHYQSAECFERGNEWDCRCDIAGEENIDFSMESDSSSTCRQAIDLCNEEEFEPDLATDLECYTTDQFTADDACAGWVECARPGLLGDLSARLVTTAHLNCTRNPTKTSHLWCDLNGRGVHSYYEVELDDVVSACNEAFDIGEMRLTEL